MKKILLTLLAATALLSAGAAEESAVWLTDFAAAQAKALAEKKLVLIDFTGSDWCPPCKQLHKAVLTSPEFTAFAKANLVLVLADFPRTKKLPPAQVKANEALSEKFQIEGYPTVIVLDGSGKQLSKEVGYDGTKAKDYVNKLAKLKGT